MIEINRLSSDWDPFFKYILLLLTNDNGITFCGNSYMGVHF